MRTKLKFLTEIAKGLVLINDKKLSQEEILDYLYKIEKGIKLIISPKQRIKAEKILDYLKENGK